MDTHTGIHTHKPKYIHRVDTHTNQMHTYSNHAHTRASVGLICSEYFRGLENRYLTDCIFEVKDDSACRLSARDLLISPHSRHLAFIIIILILMLITVKTMTLVKQHLGPRWVLGAYSIYSISTTNH